MCLIWIQWYFLPIQLCTRQWRAEFESHSSQIRDHLQKKSSFWVAIRCHTDAETYPSSAEPKCNKHLRGERVPMSPISAFDIVSRSCREFQRSFIAFTSVPFHHPHPKRSQKVGDIVVASLVVVWPWPSRGSTEVDARQPGQDLFDVWHVLSQETARERKHLVEWDQLDHWILPIYSGFS